MPQGARRAKRFKRQAKGQKDSQQANSHGPPDPHMGRPPAPGRSQKILSQTKIRERLASDKCIALEVRREARSTLSVASNRWDRTAKSRV